MNNVDSGQVSEFREGVWGNPFFRQKRGSPSVAVLRKGVPPVWLALGEGVEEVFPSGLVLRLIERGGFGFFGLLGRVLFGLFAHGFHLPPLF